MSTTKAPNRMRLPVDQLKDLIRRSVNTIKAAKADRKEANADVALAMETMENAGIPKAAARLAMQYAEWDEDGRAGFDVAYQFVRDALGVPFETQLFDADGQPNLKFAEPAEAGEPKKRGRPPGSGKKTQTEEIAETILGDGPTMQ